MKIFSPELLPHWITGQIDRAEDTIARDDDVLSPSQQEALKALAERVNAARSTV